MRADNLKLEIEGRKPDVDVMKSWQDEPVCVCLAHDSVQTVPSTAATAARYPRHPRSSSSFIPSLFLHLLLLKRFLGRKPFS